MRTLRLTCLALVCCLGLLSACGEDRPKSLAMGEIAPAFSATDMQGKPVALDAYQGKPVILRFFQPDCKFCRADTAIFNDYYRTYKDKGLGVLYIDVAPQPGEIQRFVDELSIAFPVLLDTDRKVADRYRVQLVPQTVVLDPGHKVIGAILGGVSKEELNALLLPFLK